MKLMRQTPGVERRITGIPASARAGGIMPSDGLSEFQRGFIFPFQTVGNAGGALLQPVAAPLGTLAGSILPFLK
jgi:hypothetical protein